MEELTAIKARAMWPMVGSFLIKKSVMMEPVNKKGIK